MQSQLGQGGWLTLLAFVIGALVRLVKSDSMAAVLGRFDLPPIPKPALPYVALVLGAGGSVLDAEIAGATWQAALLAGAWGLVAGAVAIAGNETLPAATRAIGGDGVANVIFGKATDASGARTEVTK